MTTFSRMKKLAGLSESEDDLDNFKVTAPFEWSLPDGTHVGESSWVHIVSEKLEDREGNTGWETREYYTNNVNLTEWDVESGESADSPTFEAVYHFFNGKSYDDIKSETEFFDMWDRQKDYYDFDNKEVDFSDLDPYTGILEPQSFSFKFSLFNQGDKSHETKTFAYYKWFRGKKPEWSFDEL